MNQEEKLVLQRMKVQELQVGLIVSCFDYLLFVACHNNNNKLSNASKEELNLHQVHSLSHILLYSVLNMQSSIIRSGFGLLGGIDLLGVFESSNRSNSLKPGMK